MTLSVELQNAVIAARCSEPPCGHRPPTPAGSRGGSEERMGVEVYTEERLAEFILNGAVDAGDYADARREVEGMGLDPDEIEHEAINGACHTRGAEGDWLKAEANKARAEGGDPIPWEDAKRELGLGDGEVGEHLKDTHRRFGEALRKLANE